MSKLTPRREQVIRGKANELIDEMWRSKEEASNRRISEIELLPIEPYAIATQLGLHFETIEEFSRSQVRGILEGRVATLAQRPSLAVRRFTAAHELGHYLLHERGVHHREMGQRMLPETEYEAETFASELLMPEGLVRRVFATYFEEPIDGRRPDDNLAFYLSRGIGRTITASQLARMIRRERARLIARATSFGGRQFKSLCEVFGVSVEAMAIRLEELDLVM